MSAIYEFTAYLRVTADDEEEARRLARDLADAVSHGEAMLALDGSLPSVEDEEDGEP